MAYHFLNAVSIVAAFLAQSSYGEDVDILSLVDPLIGTSNGGHVFPGATLPFAMAKAGADVNAENQGGFSTDSMSGKIIGFSHMHDSGTGGVSLTSSPSPPPPSPRRRHHMMTTHFLETS